jgi:putative CocE/NonD family hydrolase
MKTARSLPSEVRIVENTFITMPDGARLAARLWIPVGAEARPVPGVIEYIPYRKRDLTRIRDDINHGYIAGHGYACVRVDMRGSGDSDGVLVDEYTRQEQDDAVDAIAWIARQPWCNGRVGMMGISWGGFNSLQVAARRPPALRAIISASATDDLYSDNMHYMGGCLLGDNLSEATVMFAFNSLPPDPEIVGGRWREMWFQRLEGSGLWLEKWLAHQRRDDYWRGGSVCEDYSAIRCPVMAVGGWADGYTNAIFRLLSHLEVPCKGLIGPWGHKYPHMGQPGPAIGFLQEVVRWWDHWLKGEDRGIMDEADVRVWMQNSVPPFSSYEARPGRWIGEPGWPSPNVRPVDYPLSPHRILMHGHSERRTAGGLTLQSPLSVGMFAGKWSSYSAAPDLPSDQREEDGGSLVFDSDVLEQPLEIFGRPELDLELIPDRPLGMIAARLSDVAPNGEATRITYGLLNLAHREGHAEPQALEPGQRYRVRLELNGIAQNFPAGHRLRLSLSTSYWPLAWAPASPMLLTILPGASVLRLPVRPARPEDERLRPFDDPEGAPPPPARQLTSGDHNWRLIRDMAQDRSTLEVINNQGSFLIEDIGVEVRRDTQEWYTFRDNDFTSARGETRTQWSLRRGDWQVETTTRTVLTCTRTDFHIHAQIDAYEGERRVYSRNWNRSIPRDHV